MGRISKPTHTKLHPKKSVVSSVTRDNGKGANNVIETALNRQRIIDLWNTEYVGKKTRKDIPLEDFFSKIQLEGVAMIVQMYMEDYIKDYSVEEVLNNVTNEEGEVVYNDKGEPETTKGVHLSIVPGVSQIDNRKRTTDPPSWVDTPFPLIDKGVIVAISYGAQLFYHELKEKLAKYDKEAADKIVVPKVGDTVYLNQFMFKEARFYPDKNAKTKDFVKSQEELRLGEFDYLFRITNYEIESIVASGVDEMFDAPKSLTQEIISEYNSKNTDVDSE